MVLVVVVVLLLFLISRITGFAQLVNETYHGGVIREYICLCIRRTTENIYDADLEIELQ